jgi:hypothetical protein
MKPLLNAVALVCLFVAPFTARSDPHDEGIAAGQAANVAAQPKVNGSEASAIVPGYGSAPPQVSLYGVPSLARQANARLQTCRASLADATCQALVGALDSANTPRARVSPNDPALASARAIASNPSATLGNRLPSGLSNFNTAYADDADFARTMTMLEAARESGVYLDIDKLTVFDGEGNSCSVGLLKNCCRVDAAGARLTNQRVFGAGSTLVYDVLTNSINQQFIRQGVASLLGGAGFSGSFTTYGVTVALEGAALPAGSTLVGSAGSMAVAFNPWSLAVSVVLYVALDAMACGDGENKLAMKRGAGLCHETGEYCSRRLLGRCITRTHTHCCFNSKLSRIVNEQGRVQVGKAWGSARAPDCGGFGIAQLQSLDFAAMDLTEFYASIVPTLPDADAIRANNAARAPVCYQGQGRC